ncbi:MAG: signal recognition particle protein [Alphaproteobacteria bacterium]|nr:signal recognition particle protein [Alphaproteobacteria bacterium]
MFDSLTTRLTSVFERLTKRGALSEADVNEGLREVRIALLEADVALPVVKDFIAQVKDKAVGAEVTKSITPGQQLIKVVHDHLVETLGADESELSLSVEPPAVVLMAGLQGSGKTTTSAKLAMRLARRDKKRCLLASLDTRRPAAMEQLAVLGKQAGVDVLPIVAGQNAVAIAKRAAETARLEGYDVVILDTAGRLHVDQELMDEVAAVHDISRPAETLLVVDSLTGQDAVNVARQFKARLPLSGIVLTRVDGDGRGGAALSMRAVTGCPIKLIGVGERLEALEGFHPAGIASRILGMGDIVSLVEKAQATVDQKEAERMAAKVQKGAFDLDDLAKQIQQMKRMGGMDGLMGLLPGVGKVKKQLAEAKVDDSMLARQLAIIQSMTKAERKNPKVLNASRRRRIASGSGTTIQEVNRLLKQFQQMSEMVKKIGKLGPKGLLRGLPPGALPPGFPRGGMT